MLLQDWILIFLVTPIVLCQISILIRLFNIEQRLNELIEKEQKCQKVVIDIPIIQPKRGEWVKKNTFHIINTTCVRICGKAAPNYRKYNYCPNCEAKMVETKESEEQNAR